MVSGRVGRWMEPSPCTVRSCVCPWSRLLVGIDAAHSEPTSQTSLGLVPRRRPLACSEALHDVYSQARIDSDTRADAGSD